MSYWEVIAVEYGGNWSWFARDMGVSRQVLNHWRRRGVIPAKHAMTVQRVMRGKVTAQQVLECAAQR